MKKSIFVILVFCSIAYLGMAQTSGADGKVTLPTGKFEFTELEHDFGKIKEGVKAEHIFKFKNVGQAPIVIQNVRASCGCTIPEKPKEPIAPGKTSHIKVTYNSQNRPGNFFKTITITSNAAETTKYLQIKGFVVQNSQK